MCYFVRIYTELSLLESQVEFCGGYYTQVAKISKIWTILQQARTWRKSKNIKTFKIMQLCMHTYACLYTCVRMRIHTYMRVCSLRVAKNICRFCNGQKHQEKNRARRFQVDQMAAERGNSLVTQLLDIPDHHLTYGRKQHPRECARNLRVSMCVSGRPLINMFRTLRLVVWYGLHTTSQQAAKKYHTSTASWVWISPWPRSLPS